jgi:hypothetical protein
VVDGISLGLLEAKASLTPTGYFSGTWSTDLGTGGTLTLYLDDWCLHDRIFAAVNNVPDERQTGICFDDATLFQIAAEIALGDINKLKQALREIRESVSDRRVTRSKIQNICDDALKRED